MKKSLIILILLIYLFIINIFLVPNFVSGIEEVKLNILKFNETEVDIDKVKADISETVKIPLTLDFSGDVSMITVVFENENGNTYGPASIYLDSVGKKDLEIQIGQQLDIGTTYYLTDVFLMEKVGDEYHTQKQYVTKKSKTPVNGYKVVDLDYDYSFKVFSSGEDNTKLNILKFNETEVDIDKVKADIDETVKIPVTLDFLGDVSMITVVFENENGNTYGPASIYLDSVGKKDLEIQIGQPLDIGTTYYLTDVFLMKKVGDEYHTQKQYVTKKSKLLANGYGIVDLDYDYSFKVFSSNINNDIKKDDDTVAIGTIPQTGTAQNIIIIAIITGIGMLSVIILFRYKKMKNLQNNL